VISDPNFGLNLILTGLTGKIIFLYVLFENSFRMQIIRQLRFLIRKGKSFEDIQLFIYEKAISTQNV